MRPPGRRRWPPHGPACHDASRSPLSDADDRRSLTAEPEHVENLNYLQCLWAHAAVYANRCDFAFARRVFRKNPHYRGIPTTSLIEMTALVPDQADAR